MFARNHPTDGQWSSFASLASNLFQNLGTITGATIEDFALGIVNSITATNTFFRATWKDHDAFSGVYNGGKLMMQSSGAQYSGYYNGTTVTVNTLAKINSVVTKSTTLNSLDAQSARTNGWVLRLNGEDANGKSLSVGFDATGGIYCYYDGTQLWNIRP